MGNLFLSAAHQQHTNCRSGKFLLCGCNQSPLRFSMGRMGNPLRHHFERRLSRPRASPIGGRFILGETGAFVFNLNKRWGLSIKTASLGMNCREPKPNSRPVCLKALSVGMGWGARPLLEADQLILLLTNTRLERLMRQSPEHRTGDAHRRVGGFQ